MTDVRQKRFFVSIRVTNGLSQKVTTRIDEPFLFLGYSVLRIDETRKCHRTIVWLSYLWKSLHQQMNTTIALEIGTERSTKTSIDVVVVVCAINISTAGIDTKMKWERKMTIRLLSSSRHPSTNFYLSTRSKQIIEWYFQNKSVHKWKPINIKLDTKLYSYCVLCLSFFSRCFNIWLGYACSLVLLTIATKLFELFVSMFVKHPFEHKPVECAGLFNSIGCSFHQHLVLILLFFLSISISISGSVQFKWTFSQLWRQIIIRHWHYHDHIDWMLALQLQVVCACVFAIDMQA